MTDLISRQAAIEATCYNCTEKESCNGICDDTNRLRDLPTIDPVNVKRGKWELHEYPDGYYHTECSECGVVYDEMVYFLKKAHYCPNCGAKMDEVEDAIN